MSLFRRRLMTDATAGKEILLHQWRAENGFQGGKWRDEVRDCKYSHPIDWENAGATIENGYVITSEWRTLHTSDFSNIAEKFGKFWCIELEVGSVGVSGNGKPRYLIDVCTSTNEPNSVSESLYIRDNNILSRLNLNYRAAPSHDELGVNGIPYDGFLYTTISFGIDNVGGGYGRHFIKVGTEKTYNSAAFSPKDIGRELTWSRGLTFIGRTYTDGTYDSVYPLLIKRISIYRL